jgi:DNA-damage-inducible protein J
MSVKTEIITAKLDAELKNSFMAIAASRHRPASQVLRDLIRLYVENNEIPNKETLETFQKTDRGEGIIHAKNTDDLFAKLGI